MNGKKFLLLNIILSVLVMTGCSGTPTTTILARDEATSILLVGRLVGGTVELNNGFRKTFTKADLQDEPVTDISTVKDSDYQKLDKILLKVRPGELTLNFTSPGGQQTNRRLYVTPGITNELRLD